MRTPLVVAILVSFFLPVLFAPSIPIRAQSSYADLKVDVSVDGMKNSLVAQKPPVDYQNPPTLPRVELQVGKVVKVTVTVRSTGTIAAKDFGILFDQYWINWGRLEITVGKKYYEISNLAPGSSLTVTNEYRATKRGEELIDLCVLGKYWEFSSQDSLAGRQWLVRIPVTITWPALTLSADPTTVHQGESIAVKGNWFSPNSQATVYVGPSGGPFFQFKADVGSDGSFSLQIFIGDNIPSGIVDVRADDSGGDSSNTVRITVAVRSSPSTSLKVLTTESTVTERTENYTMIYVISASAAVLVGALIILKKIRRSLPPPPPPE